LKNAWQGSEDTENASIQQPIGKASRKPSEPNGLILARKKEGETTSKTTQKEPKQKLPIEVAYCEMCGSRLVKAAKIITRNARIYCEPCSKKIPEEQILRRL